MIIQKELHVDINKLYPTESVASIRPEIINEVKEHISSDGKNTVIYIIEYNGFFYIVKGHHIQIAIINSVNVNELLSRKKKILEEMIKFNKDNKKELFFFAIIDIIKLDSTIFVCGNLSHTVETAFNITLKNNEAILKGVTSRKKQIYPKIENIINAIF